MTAEAMDIEPAVTAPPAAPSKPQPTTSLMWVEKYRPRGLSDLLSHQSIIETLRKLIASNRMPHLLFHGPPGTGKTSTILACAREMYGTSFRSMVLELNASDDRGIDVVRDQIKTFASTKRIFSSGVKLIILDEADAMTSAAQAALRRVVEKYVANTRFCLICNYVNKISPALQSRCTKFRFGPIPPADAMTCVERVAAAEGATLAPGAADALLVLAKGDMRRVLNIFQSTSMATSGVITADALYANTGDANPADVAALFAALIDPAAEFQKCAARIEGMKAEKGVAVGDVLPGLVDIVRNAPRDRLGPEAKIYLFRQLADCEYRLAVGGSERINSIALVGAFMFAGDM